MQVGFRMSKDFLVIARGAIVLAMMLAILPPFSVPSASAAEVTVQMKDLKFAPATLNVAVGSTVIWNNLDKPSHNIAIDRGPEIFVSPEQKQGQTSRFTFTKPGTYHYFCEFHPFMQATVVVADPRQSGLAAPAYQPTADTFAETGKTVRGGFLSYWNTRGGLAQQGFPISEEITEKS